MVIAQSYGFALVIGLAVVIYLGGLVAALSLGHVADESAVQPGHLRFET
jgi:hypothetical protein